MNRVEAMRYHKDTIKSLTAYVAKASTFDEANRLLNLVAWRRKELKRLTKEEATYRKLVRRTLRNRKLTS